MYSAKINIFTNNTRNASEKIFFLIWIFFNHVSVIACNNSNLLNIEQLFAIETTVTYNY